MKRIISLLLCMLLLLGSTGGYAEATGFVFDDENYAITKYSGAGGNLVVPDELADTPVESIYGNVFYGNNSITSLVLPETLIDLGYTNIYNMDSLSSITLPESLVVIDDANFAMCDLLAEVDIPARVSFIGDRSFCYCSNLKTIRFHGEAPAFGIECFVGMPADLVIYVPDDQLSAYQAALPEGLNIQPSGEMAKIYDYTASADEFDFDPSTGTILSYNAYAARVDVPASIDCVLVRAIGESAFEGHRYVYYVTIPEGIIEIGDAAFKDTWHLSYVDMPTTASIIGSEAFRGYNGSRFDFPATLSSIGDYAFHQAKLTGGVKLPIGLMTIGSYAFDSTQAPFIELPLTVFTLGEGALRANRSLTEVTLPRSLIQVGSQVLQDCERVTKLNIECDPAIIPADAFAGMTALENIWIASGEAEEFIQNLKASVGDSVVVETPANSAMRLMVGFAIKLLLAVFCSV